jgi:peptidoglycan/xylan/chitin deacetylase (PgdA/CDA1 family)
MDRRTFLRRAGLGSAGVAAVAAPVGTYAFGHHLGSRQLSGNYTESVRAGQQRGAVNVWWSVDTDERVLALTFDDGPTEQFSGTVLDILARYEVPATFFLIGELVERRPDDVRRMIDEGHEVANHTFDHFSAAIQSVDDVRRTMEQGADAVARILGERPRWFRPVRGHVTGTVLATAASLGHDVALWSVSRDPGIGTGIDDVVGVRTNYVDGVHEGAIVIFHDGIGRSAFELTGPDEELVTARRTEIEALPDVVERYLEEGYRIVTMSELLDRYGSGAAAAPEA